MLSAGESFGELALIKNKPRAATVRCNSEKVYLGVIDRNDYKKVLQRIEQKRIDAVTNFLYGLPLFGHWDRHLLVKLQYFFETQSFGRKQRVFSEGDPAKHVFIVKSGEFQMLAQLRQTKERTMH